AIRDFLILAEAGMAVAAELKQPEERTEEEKMALLGKPKLGEVSKAQIRIKESKEFKNTVDKLVQRANASILLVMILKDKEISNIYSANTKARISSRKFNRRNFMFLKS
ncbi:sodium/calcium exchanger 1 isoform X1, partial [Vespula squamosa]